MRRSSCPRMGQSLSACFGLVFILTLLFPCAVSTLAWPLHDPVLEWIGITNDTALAAGTNPLVTSRVVALVSASVYDAVNGIEPRCQPFFVKPDAPPGASQRAAAIQAAYEILFDIYGTNPALATDLANHLTTSLTALAEHEKADSIHAGTAWGKTVADAIWVGALPTATHHLRLPLSVYSELKINRRQSEFGDPLPRQTHMVRVHNSPP
jgi:hypothetical protein